MDIVNDVMKVADTGFHPRASASFLSSQCLFLSSQCLILGSRNFTKLVSIKVLC
ncbi:hypothetical protein [Wolbachia endosymbiont (group B) of Limnophora tigrina]|uniref:hypothetical protein n=1 Tax=Wolbachia endosymbiont (group B) of Limnophora tigrina TaxID=3139317 RepID=UPI0035B51DB4